MYCTRRSPQIMAEAFWRQCVAYPQHNRQTLSGLWQMRISWDISPSSKDTRFAIERRANPWYFANAEPANSVSAQQSATSNTAYPI